MSRFTKSHGLQGGHRKDFSKPRRTSRKFGYYRTGFVVNGRRAEVRRTFAGHRTQDKRPGKQRRHHDVSSREDQRRIRDPIGNQSPVALFAHPALVPAHFQFETCQDCQRFVVCALQLCSYTFSIESSNFSFYNSLFVTGGHIDFDDINFDKRNYNSFQAYAQSKLANVLFTKQLSKIIEVCIKTKLITSSNFI